MYSAIFSRYLSLSSVERDLQKQHLVPLSFHIQTHGDDMQGLQRPRVPQLGDSDITLSIVNGMAE